MSTEKTWQMQSTSSDATEVFGEAIGRRLKGGEVIELTSDLGGGKTTFVRGLARGAGSNDRVASPTFTISREYRAPRFDIMHFDFYRLHEAGIVAEELREIVGDPGVVTVVEWGDAVESVLPAERLSISFLRSNDEVREITCRYPDSLNYIFAGLNI